MGLRGLSFGPERADFGFERADFRLERADLGPERALWGRCPKQVIQGSHMVSSTRCPAQSDQVKWIGSREAAPKSRCPVEH